CEGVLRQFESGTTRRSRCPDGKPSARLYKEGFQRSSGCRNASISACRSSGGAFGKTARKARSRECRASARSPVITCNIPCEKASLCKGQLTDASIPGHRRTLGTDSDGPKQVQLTKNVDSPTTDCRISGGLSLVLVSLRSPACTRVRVI